MKEKYVYIVSNEFYYDGRNEDNWVGVDCIFTSLKKAIDHLKIWAEIHEGAMRSRGELSKEGNYVELQIDEEKGEYSHLYVRKDDELRVRSIRKHILR